MIKYFLPVVLTIWLCGCAMRKEVRHCHDFRNGDFLYHVRRGDADFFFNILRRDSVQTEINQLTGDTSILRVQWIDSCSYYLSTIKRNNTHEDSLRGLPPANVRTTIVQPEAEYYIFVTGAPGYSFELRDTLWVDKKAR